jgi:hypothetical protein
MTEEQIAKLTFEIIQSLAIIIAAFVGIYGINSWRREAKWKRKYELAEEVLSLVYEVKENIEMIRSDLTGINEGKTRKKSDKETKEESEIRDTAFATVERANSVNESFKKLQAIKFRFVAVFNQSDSSLIDELIRIRNKLISTAHRLADARVIVSKQSNPNNEHYQRIERFEKIIWFDYDKEDEITTEVNKAVKGIENICKVVIERSA